MEQATRLDPPRLVDYFERFWREGALWATIMLAMYLVLALASYSPTDPGWSFAGEGVAVSNAAGRAGAWFADLSLFLLGIFAYLIPVALGWSAFLLFREREPAPETKLLRLVLRWMGVILTLGAGAGLTSLQLAGIFGNLPNGIGGGLGQLVSLLAVDTLGYGGAVLLLLALLMSGLSLFTGVSPVLAVDGIGDLTLMLLRLPYQLVDQLRGHEPLDDQLAEIDDIEDLEEIEDIEDFDDDLDDPPGNSEARDIADLGETSASRQAPTDVPPTLDLPWLQPASHRQTDQAERSRATANAAAASRPNEIDGANAPRRQPVEALQLRADAWPWSRRRTEPNETPVLDGRSGERSEGRNLAAHPEASPWHPEGLASPPQPNVRQAEPSPQPRAEVPPRPSAGTSTFDSPAPFDLGPASSAAVEDPTDAPTTRRAASARSEPWAQVDAQRTGTATPESALTQSPPPAPRTMPPPPPTEPVWATGAPEATAAQAALPSTRHALTQSQTACRSGISERPPLELLDPPRRSGNAVTPEQLETMSRELEARLAEFGVVAEVVEVHPGPVVALFELELAPGVKVSKITGLSKDIARALSKISVRVVEVIPGKSVIGLEVPNDQREMVTLSEILGARVYQEAKSPLTIGMGTNISGEPVVADLARMPHALIAGTTGSGKSVAINAMILSLVYKAPPEDVRLIMVDPKMLELSVYEGIPHLLTPVVTDMKEAANALRWCVGEMERRYKLMASLGVRNIAGYNRKVQDAIAAGQPIRDPTYDSIVNAAVAEGLEPPEVPTLEKLPNIVVIIDELADMMMVVGKKVEELIARLAQKARASGIHLLLATQRPSVDVLTGLIKANIPTRMAFKVSARVDSRTVLDQMGAEHLLGHGDMLYLPPGGSISQRVHGAFVDDHEVHRVVDFLKQQGEPDYIEDILQEPSEHLPGIDPEPKGSGDVEDQDPLFDEAVQIVVESRRASISGVQRRLKIGYNRAARMIEEMERIGVVGPAESNGNREVLAPPPP